MNALEKNPDEAAQITEVESQYQFLLSKTQALLKILNDGKWWAPPLASLISILLLSKYLWMINHPELILNSIGSPSNLLVWLVFTALGFSLVLVNLSLPAVSFTACMALIAPDHDSEAKIAKYLGRIVIIGYILILISLPVTTYLYKLPTWATPTTIFIISLAASGLMQYKKILPEKPSPNPSKQKSPVKENLKTCIKILSLSTLLTLTALCGISPAQIAILAWRGTENGLEATLAILSCLIMMVGYLIPILLFYQFKGNLIQRAGKTSLAILLAIFFNTIMMPAFSDIWVYTAANLLKIRDDRPLGYILDQKEYPKALFDSPSWAVQTVENSTDLFSVNAFRQFRFGDVLLLCPAPYSKVKLKDIETFSDRCITVSDAKVKVAAKRVLKIKQIPPDPHCLLAMRTAEIIPLPLKKSMQCIYKTTL